jgi:hypothetical protein
MEHNYLDVSTKELIWDGPADWLRRYGIDTAGGLEVVDSDASTLTAAADKIIKVNGEQPFLVDLEPHSYHDIDVVRRLWLRQAALDHRHNLPVLTLLILLYKKANSPGLSGVYERRLPDGTLTNWYHYRVVRLWEEDPEDYLNAGIAVVPLAPLTNVSRADLPGVVHRMRQRIDAEPRPRANTLLTVAYFLMGLRYPDDLVQQLLGGVKDMIESATYRKVLNDGLQEGRILGERRLLLRVGTKKFGEPDAAIVAALDAIQDADRLEALGLRIIDADVRGWEDLLRGS